MSSWKIIKITYGKCVNMIGARKKDWCAHFLAGGEEGTPEAFFCRGCGCHLCFHEKEVETSYDRSTSTVSYTQCLKNHKDHTGGSWVDGCGEFVAAGEEGTPEALSCAACGCHRSFHKKEYWIGGEPKDHCRHFLAGGKEGTPESFFCHGCGCHLCFHWKYVEKEIDMSTAIVKYGKCVKNHTAHLGGRSTLDGCGEFVAAGEEGTQEAFSCAACSCHRSFHEKDYL